LCAEIFVTRGDMSRAVVQLRLEFNSRSSEIKHRQLSVELRVEAVAPAVVVVICKPLSWSN